MRLSEITRADRCRIRLRTESPQSDPYRGIPPKPAQPARQTRTGVQAPRPPQPPKPPPKAIPPTPADPPEPPQPRADGGQLRPPKQAKRAKPEIVSK
jgi:hypothetical protein